MPVVVSNNGPRPQANNNGTSTTTSTSTTTTTTTPTAPTTPAPALPVVSDGFEAAASLRTKKAAEKSLGALGLKPGTVDGRFGEHTRDALRTFQRARGLPQTGELDERTYKALRAVDDQRKRGIETAGLMSSGVKKVEQRLKRLGYDVGSADGLYTKKTAEAVKQFKADQKLESRSGNFGERGREVLKKETAALAHKPYRSRVKNTDAHKRADRAATAATHARGGVKLGDSGPAVATLQRHLKAAGFDTKTTNGTFNARTQGMVKEFQKKAGLNPTGVVGAGTWKQLRKAQMEATSATSPKQSIGERSSAVKATEKRLKKLGFNPGKVDGTYDQKTQKALDKFRKAYGLGSRGQGVGPATLKALKNPPNRIVQPIGIKPTTISEFGLVDAEGAPDNRGVRHHAGKDWFAPGGSRVGAPVAGKVVEVRPTLTTSGQVFGGTVKVQDKSGKVWVFRHVDPKGVRVGQSVAAGQKIATVTNWRDGPDHAHVEVWKSLSGGYDFENMIDPMKFFKRFT